ncbi:MAG: MATE family efflux transporter, partial [Clostridia bacterium]
ACVDSLTALGQAKIAITLSLTRKVLIMTTLIVVLPIFLGVDGVYFAEPIADISAAIISGVTSVFVIKKLLKKRGEMTELTI